jgi:hypothetical protein
MSGVRNYISNIGRTLLYKSHCPSSPEEGDDMNSSALATMHGVRGVITPKQQTAYDLYQKHNNLSVVARIMGINAAGVSKHLMAYERNKAIISGHKVPKISQLIKAGEGNSAERVKLLLATSEGVTTEKFRKKTKAGKTESETDNSEAEKPEPKRIFATGERIIKRTIIPLPETGMMTVITTCAQDATPVHPKLWQGIQALLKHFEKYGQTKLMVGTSLYNKGAFGDPATQERHFLDPHQLYQMEEIDIKKTVFFDHCLDGHLVDDRIEIDGILDICGETNILPTAERPLSGFNTYTGMRSGIFPHVKQHIETPARMPTDPVRTIMSTGTVTMPNYIRKKAGQKAEQHHTLGFAITHVMPSGQYWTMLVKADSETGAFYHLDLHVADGQITKGNRVASISYGDIHHEKLDARVARLLWGLDTSSNKTVPEWLADSMLERLKPEYQFFHDVSDFAPRNHHRRNDPGHWISTAYRNEDCVDTALKGVSDFLRETRRDWCKSVVVRSNHDSAMKRWMDSPQVIEDGRNAYIYHHANAIRAKALMEGREVDVFEHILREKQACALKDVLFVDARKSFRVYGVEHALHGDKGPNGARGTPNNLFRVYLMITAGHTHSPFQRDGFVSAGCCNLYQGYNEEGPSGWAIAFVIGHKDGSRQICFCNDIGFLPPCLLQ